MDGEERVDLRCLGAGLHVHKVDVNALNLGLELRSSVQFCLLGSPVVSAVPVLDQVDQLSGVHSVVEGSIGEVVNESGLGEAATDVRQLRFGK